MTPSWLHLYLYLYHTCTCTCACTCVMRPWLYLYYTYTCTCATTPVCWWQTVLGMTPWEFPGCAASSHQWLRAHQAILGPQTTLPRNCLRIALELPKSFLRVTSESPRSYLRITFPSCACGPIRLFLEHRPRYL